MDKANFIRSKLLVVEDKEMKTIKNKIIFNNNVDVYETISFKEIFYSTLQDECKSTSTQSSSILNSKNKKEDSFNINNINIKFLQNLCGLYKNM